MIKIYSLTHPSSSRIYIGKTTQSLKRRLCGHIDESKRLPNIRKNRWIHKLINNNFMPEIKLVAETQDDHGDEKERHYIKLGWQVAPNDMLNSPLMPGGEGFQRGHNIDKASRDKSSRTRRKFTNESLKIIASRINAGELLKDIAKELGVHRATLIRNLKGRVIDTEAIIYKNNHVSGSKHPQAKINQSIANVIREKYATGQYFQYQLAEEFQIAQSLVWAIIKNKIWKGNKGE